jgi:acetyltransferase-like isoleucine patch superfamily enzyme
MKYFIAFILFILPSRISIHLAQRLSGGNFKVGKNCKIGFSVILADRIVLGNNIYIGHLNFMKILELNMGDYSRIKKINAIKGRFSIELAEKAVINQLCRITSRLDNYKSTVLRLGFNSIIGVSHTIDMTDNFTMDSNSILAGIRSQVWTHGFYHSSKTMQHWQINGEVKVGKNCYIGSSCILCAGIEIVDNTTIGAGVVVPKSLTDSGLYVSAPIRYMEFVPEERIKRYTQVADGIYERKL